MKFLLMQKKVAHRHSLLEPWSLGLRDLITKGVPYKLKY